MEQITKEYDRAQLIDLVTAAADRAGQTLAKPATDMTPRELRATLAALQDMPAAPLKAEKVKA